jgi:peptide/nickel transport system permease protein
LRSINSKEFLGVFSFAFIVILLLFLDICLCLAPDNSENANQMHPFIQTAGFQCEYAVYSFREKQKRTVNYFLGFPNSVLKWLSKVTRWWETIVYVEYNDEPSLKMVKELT